MYKSRNSFKINIRFKVKIEMDSKLKLKQGKIFCTCHTELSYRNDRGFTPTLLAHNQVHILQGRKKKTLVPWENTLFLNPS